MSCFINSVTIWSIPYKSWPFGRWHVFPWRISGCFFRHDSACAQHQLPWLAVTDFVIPLIPLGLGAGRIGNFINAELWGRPTDVPWAMVFPYVDELPRHPSQLYQFALEGIVLFLFIWIYSSKPRATGAVTGMFMIGYGVLRSFAEFFREPEDGFMGILTLGITMGQWLSIPMILAGITAVIWSNRQTVTPESHRPAKRKKTLNRMKSCQKYNGASNIDDLMNVIRFHSSIAISAFIQLFR
jgi:prolipoprotein diacylglyceryl transferase